MALITGWMRDARRIPNAERRARREFPSEAGNRPLYAQMRPKLPPNHCHRRSDEAIPVSPSACASLSLTDGMLRSPERVMLHHSDPSAFSELNDLTYERRRRVHDRASKASIPRPDFVAERSARDPRSSAHPSTVSL